MVSNYLRKAFGRGLRKAFGRGSRSRYATLAKFGGAGANYAYNRFQSRRKLARKRKLQSGISITQTKKKRKRQKEMNLDRIGRGYIYLGGPKRPLSLSTQGRWVYRQSHSGRFSGVVGKQFATSMFCMNTSSQTTVSTGTPYSYLQNDTALRQMNPYATSTGSSVMPTLGVGMKNDRFGILYNVADIMFTNFSTVACNIDVFVYECVKSGKEDPHTSWQDGYVNGPYAVVETFGAPGTAAGASHGYADRDHPYAHPLESAQFRQFWKIRAQDKIMLTSGASHTLKIKNIVNKIVQQEVDAQYFTDGYLFVGGRTYVVGVRALGQLVNDNTAGGYDLPTYAPVEVGWVAQVKTVCCAVSGNADRISSNLFVQANVPTSANLADLQEIDQEDTIIIPQEL